MRWWSLTQWLIAINIAIFVIDWVTSGALTEIGAFSAKDGIFRLQIWRWVTCQFLHHDPPASAVQHVGPLDIRASC